MVPVVFTNFSVVPCPASPFVVPAMVMMLSAATETSVADVTAPPMRVIVDPNAYAVSVVVVYV